MRRRPREARSAKLLHMLERARGGFVPFADLASALGGGAPLSQSQIAQDAGMLRDSGWRIESVRGVGMRLLGAARPAATAAARRVRRCLGAGCGAEFVSEHAGNRLCSVCRPRAASEVQSYAVAAR